MEEQQQEAAASQLLNAAMIIGWMERESSAAVKRMKG